MRSGLQPYPSDNIIFQTDQLAWGVNRDVAEAPGGTWEYQNGDSMLVSRGIEVAVGRSFIEYANEVLLEPLGMDAKWWTDSVGNALGYCCIDATARDFARFGLLFSRTGDWAGTPLVPSTWVIESTTPVAMTWTTVALVDVQRRLASPPLEPTASLSGCSYFDLVIVRNGLYEKRGDPDEYRIIEALIPMLKKRVTLMWERLLSRL